ncbi:MAG TPA: hypothetical protein VM012_03260 [Flavitalea sp.]|nr:hypothetical protein [Flavitalea sp.]
MRKFFTELKNRNRILYWFGWINLLASIICIFLTGVDDTIIFGINAWIKPMKFFISITIFCWTMGWILDYLQQPRKTWIYSWMVIIVMTYEMIVICWQAAHGRLSHFNIATPFYAILFAIMGIAITVLGIWTAYMTYLFFKKKDFTLPMHVVWGIRLGLIIFIIYSFEGGLMAQQLAHTIGGKDGSPGLPLVNWSRQYGDLRIAHFLGMHALQILPLVAWHFTATTKQVIILSVVYFVVVTAAFIQALMGLPLL